MSLLKNIHSQISTQIPSLSSEALSQYLPTIVPTLAPTAVYPHMASNSQVENPEPELVYASLTVQDIQEQQYYYSYLIEKGKGKEVVVLKYGFDLKKIQQIQMKKYQTVMENREVLVCVGAFYQSDWVQNQANGQTNIKQTVILKVPGQHQFRLGQRINAVCVWNPFDKFLQFIRLATQEEILQHKLSFQSQYQSEPTNYQKCREQLLDYLETCCTSPQSHLILYSLVSPDPLFINSNYSIVEVMRELMPNVCNIKIKAPFKQSLFPYKNAEGKLVQTPMQLGNEKTYVILDFSEFSQEKEVKIGPEEIDNLKALKMFVEEGQTIYRWEYGQSLVQHKHSGMIVKGSKIIQPHFNIPLHLQSSQPPKFAQLPEQLKHTLRVYIKKCQRLNPQLTEQSREKVEKQVRQSLQKKSVNQLMLQQRMLLAKLNATTHGRENIQYEDYILAGSLLGLESGEAMMKKKEKVDIKQQACEKKQ